MPVLLSCMDGTPTLSRHMAGCGKCLSQEVKMRLSLGSEVV